MRYGFAIGGGSGGSAISAVSAVVKSKGDAVEIAVAADIVVVVSRAVVDVAVVVADAGAGSCCDWVMKIRRGMM